MRLAVFFIIYYIALTWPVGQWFNRAEPYIFGLPLSMAWVAAWVLLGWLVLVLRYRADRRAGR